MRPLAAPLVLTLTFHIGPVLLLLLLLLFALQVLGAAGAGL
jgi:hypothetical protein